MVFNSAFKGLNTKLNPICHFLALLGAHPILHVSRIRVNFVTIINLLVERMHKNGIVCSYTIVDSTAPVYP